MTGAPVDRNASFDIDNFESFSNGTFLDSNFTDMFVEELAYMLNVYLTPALIVTGIIGNLLSLIVFYKGKFQGRSTSQYLTALAISDTVFLLQLIPPWLNAVRLSPMFSWYGYCQMFVYFTYVSSADSSWLVVAFTVERFVAVIHPLRRTSVCTVRRARIVILVIILCCLAINAPVIRFTVPGGNDCNIDRELMEHAARFNVVDTVFCFTLPLTIITMLNIRIAIGVCRVDRARGYFGGNLRLRRAGRFAHRGGSSLQRSQQRITRMLLIVSTVFVVLNLPAYTMRILAYANNMSSYEYSGKWAALQQICLLVCNINFGINFLLYCATGQNFRRALTQTFPSHTTTMMSLKRILCCCGCKDDSPRDPSPSNSVSVITVVRARDSPAPWRHGSTSYLNVRRFDNSRKQVQCVDKEMQTDSYVYQTSSEEEMSSIAQKNLGLYDLRSLQALSERSTTRQPEFELQQSSDDPTPENGRTINTQIFQPLQYSLKPGEIAPFTLNSSPTELQSSDSVNANGQTKVGGMLKFIQMKVPNDDQSVMQPANVSHITPVRPQFISPFKALPAIRQAMAVACEHSPETSARLLNPDTQEH